MSLDTYMARLARV